MTVIYLVGTSDTKAEEIGYLRSLLTRYGNTVRSVDVGTRAAGCEMDVTSTEVASCHVEGANSVLGLEDRGQAMRAMSSAFSNFCSTHKNQISAIIGIGGGGGTSIVASGMRELPYGVPKVMASTLASGDVAPYVGISDIIMMPTVTDLAGLNKINRHILHNAAQAVLGMVEHPHIAQAQTKPSIGLSMFGVTTPSVTQISAHLNKRFDCVVFHATGTGGRSMETLLAQNMLDGLIDITTTEIADELVGGVLSAGPERLDAVAASNKPYVGSVGALDMVNFWAPETVPETFKDRLFYHHNDNVTLMRTTADENVLIGSWIANKLNKAKGPVRLLLPEKGVSSLDIEGGAFWDPSADNALFEAIEQNLTLNDNRRINRVPYHINDPAFSALAAETYLEIS